MTITRNVPEDIITEILLHLPVKSLCRFTCTSKAWCALIKGNDTFIQKHLHLNAGHLLVGYYQFDNKIPIQKSKFLSNDITSISVDPNLYHALKDDGIEVHGHCNGILCLQDACHSKGILWNPANRETRELPLFPQDHEEDGYWYGLRFGYDEGINDYKVVVFSHLTNSACYNRENSADDVPYRIYIYSMSNDSWKRFKGNMPSDYFSDTTYCCECLDGVLYWLLVNHGLLSFHIGDEVFEENGLPDSMPLSSVSNSRLGKYNNHVAVLCERNYDDPSDVMRRFEVWVLSSKNCWNKVLSIGPFTHVNKLVPLGFSEHDDKILFRSTYIGEDIRSLSIYDPQSQQLIDPGIRGGLFQAIPYKESLVSVKRMPQDFSQAINIAHLCV